MKYRKMFYEDFNWDEMGVDEDELLGYHCLGCGNIQNKNTGWGCDVCGGHSLNEWYG